MSWSREEEVGRGEEEERSVGRRFIQTPGLFMPALHIMARICFNQSEPRGAGEYIFSVWAAVEEEC